MPPMRILKLTPATEKQFLGARQSRDTEAERIAAKIIAEVRRDGDAALFAYAKKTRPPRSQLKKRLASMYGRSTALP